VKVNTKGHKKRHQVSRKKVRMIKRCDIKAADIGAKIKMKLVDREYSSAAVVGSVSFVYPILFQTVVLDRAFSLIFKMY
jgi:hypothetical protein